MTSHYRPPRIPATRTGSHTAHIPADPTAPDPIDWAAVERAINNDQPLVWLTPDEKEEAVRILLTTSNLTWREISARACVSEKTVDRYKQEIALMPTRHNRAATYAPDTLAHGDTWRDRAACRSEDPELFFPIGENGPALLQIEEAKTVCRRCPVIDSCLTWALDTGQQHGVWGGTSESERRSIKRREQRARNQRAAS